MLQTVYRAEKAAPDTVNPSLWRNAQLNMHYGLFKVTDGIYQVRGYDLSNITFVQGTRAGSSAIRSSRPRPPRLRYDLVTAHLGKRPVLAVIYSHSHVDHYGGVRGIVGRGDVKSEQAARSSPPNIHRARVSENVIAGNAMGRRAIYMYGPCCRATRWAG